MAYALTVSTAGFNCLDKVMRSNPAVVSYTIEDRATGEELIFTPKEGYIVVQGFDSFTYLEKTKDRHIRKRGGYVFVCHGDNEDLQARLGHAIKEYVGRLLDHSNS